jgi:hypothetical protein
MLEALLRLKHEDVAMEYFVAEGQRPVDRCLEAVRKSDVYVGIFAFRYGSIPKDHDKSITELEYREAVRTGKDCLILLLEDGTSWPVNKTDKQRDKIDALRDELQEEHTVLWFSGADDLEAKVTATVVTWEQKHAAKQGAAATTVLTSVGALHQLPPPPGDFTGRGDEMEELLRQIKGGGVTISGIQGMGGIGKTDLALKVAEHLVDRHPDAQIYLNLRGAGIAFAPGPMTVVRCSESERAT